MAFALAPDKAAGEQVRHILPPGSCLQLSMYEEHGGCMEKMHCSNIGYEGSEQGIFVSKHIRHSLNVWE